MKKLKIEDFPQVWKMGDTVEIVYRNRAEFYVKKTSFTTSGDNEKFDPYDEIELIKGNGGRRVHGNKEIQVWRK